MVLPPDQQLFEVHDAHWIPAGLTDAGKILLFNNGRDRPGGNASSVDLIQPPIDSEGQYIRAANAAFGPAALRSGNTAKQNPPCGIPVLFPVHKGFPMAIP